MDGCIMEVLEKPSVGKWMPKQEQEQEQDVVIMRDYYGPVFDTRDDGLIFCQHEDGSWYNRGEMIAVTDLALRAEGSPKPGVYICSPAVGHSIIGRTFRQVRSNPSFAMSIEGFRFYVYAHEGNAYADHMLGAMRYVEMFGINPDICSVRLYNEEHKVVSGFIPLREAWDSVSKRGWPALNHGEYNRMRRLVSMSGMGIKGFAEYFGIKYRTLQNWMGNVNSVPEWAPELFRYKLLGEGFI